MKYGSLIIEKKEFVLLKRILNLMGYYRDNTMRESVKKLLGALDTARILDKNGMPEDVIRFYSTVTLTSKNGWERKLTLVPPSEGNLRNGKLSVLSPLGTALIGFAKDDVFVVWEFSSGRQELTVRDIEQKDRAIDVGIIGLSDPTLVI